ncbi:hypothetical protein Hypma_000066 [Hypsizygus marmoreus]|uniref:Uncharacterized protein n=1 Tax=Hypsizygus marmoreus TaxID=39966 RepID=A0A369KE00_HYPMA|nr:hypothetical protein Hypma_000066 [Hypsizygus marmoreus]
MASSLSSSFKLPVSTNSRPCYINTLPPELLREVFILSLPTKREWTDTSLLSISPLSLVQVCKSWRLFVEGVPELWQTLYIHRDNIASDCLENVGPGAGRFLSHALQRSISLSIDLPSYGLITSDVLSHIPWASLVELEIIEGKFSVDMALEILACCGNLVQCTFFMLGSPCVSELVLDGPVIVLNHLEYLSVTFGSAWFPVYSASSGAETSKKISPLFEHLELPALEYLKIRASMASIDIDLPLALLECQRDSQFPLKTLEFSNVLCNTQHLRDLLSELPTLTTLHLLHTDKRCCHQYPHLLDLLSFTNGIDETGEPIKNILPNLERLKVQDTIRCTELFTDQWDHRVLDAIESRTWTAGAYPYREVGLAQLKKVTIRWDGRRHSPPIANRLNNLRRAGLIMHHTVI